MTMRPDNPILWSWRALDPADRLELQAIGLDQREFDSRPSAVRASILNARLAMVRLGLWHLVANERGSNPGNFEFDATDMDTLLRELARREDFTGPRQSRSGFWQSRQKVPIMSLHIKHFAGWPPRRVQVHVDRYGLHPRGLWWLVAPALLVAHILDYNGYKEVESIARHL